MIPYRRLFRDLQRLPALNPTRARLDGVVRIRCSTSPGGIRIGDSDETKCLSRYAENPIFIDGCAAALVEIPRRNKPGVQQAGTIKPLVKTTESSV